MPANRAFFDTWTPRALSLLRIASAYLFLLHGSAKLLGFPHVAMFDNLFLAATGPGPWSVDEARGRPVTA